MFAIVGIVIVLGAVVGGYLMEHGNLGVLFQPAELVIIGGASIGALVISSPKKVLLLITQASSPYSSRPKSARRPTSSSWSS